MKHSSFSKREKKWTSFQLKDKLPRKIQHLLQEAQPHTWLEIEEADFTNTQPISQITK